MTVSIYGELTERLDHAMHGVVDDLCHLEFRTATHTPTALKGPERTNKISILLAEKFHSDIRIYNDLQISCPI